MNSLIKIINLLFLLGMPLLFVGILNKTKAYFAGRKGAPIIQPFYDVMRLFRKGQVISVTTTIIFQIAPSINFVSLVFACLLIPAFSRQSILSFNGDLIVFAYMLSLGKFMTIISAMDTGSSFEGMGASREATFSSFAEPVYFIVFTALAAYSGCFSFQDIFNAVNAPNFHAFTIFLISAVVILILTVVEGCRVPVDDPCTHLELTMIHEVMVLDNSGFDLAVISYSAAMKILLFSCLAANLFLAPLQNLLYFNLVFPAAIIAIAIGLGIVETFMARLRMSHVPQFIIFGGSLAVISLFIILIYKTGALK